MTSPPLLLDISRTIARARLPAPTGIDRVERAYIRWALACGSRFLAGFDGHQYLVGAETVRRLVGWLDGDLPAPPLDLAGRLRPQRDARLRRAQSLVRREALARTGSDGAGLPGLPGTVFLNVGHDNLSRPLMEALRNAGARTLVLIHDTIPLDHPEFARDGTPARFRAMLEAVERVDAVIVNSADTGRRLTAHLPGLLPVAAPLGIDPPRPAAPTPGPPAFLCLGTIEPRKNHALLLNVWEGLPPDGPHLRIVGRRGWKNAELFRRLDTDPMIGRTVHEVGTPDDDTLAREIAGARAVLLPSLAEGYGLPLAEALAAGTPVIASDLPALREVGGDVPEWLAPDDPGAWRAMVADYRAEPSPRRDAQMARLAAWRPPTWEAHFAIVERTIAEIASNG